MGMCKVWDIRPWRISQSNIHKRFIVFSVNTSWPIHHHQKVVNTHMCFGYPIPDLVLSVCRHLLGSGTDVG